MRANLTHVCFFACVFFLFLCREIERGRDIGKVCVWGFNFIPTHILN